jgi:hypothetical protein
MRGERDEPPSPLWASTDELWWSWYAEDMPWSQVHGHANAWRPGAGCNGWVPEELLECAETVPARGWCRYRPPGSPHRIIGIDPGLWDHSSAGTLRALIIDSDERTRG